MMFHHRILQPPFWNGLLVGAMRKGEIRLASSVLGVSHLAFMDYLDGNTEGECPSHAPTHHETLSTRTLSTKLLSKTP